MRVFVSNRRSRVSLGPFALLVVGPFVGLYWAVKALVLFLPRTVAVSRRTCLQMRSDIQRLRNWQR